jgi:hypothetical protein
VGFQVPAADARGPAQVGVHRGTQLGQQCIEGRTRVGLQKNGLDGVQALITYNLAVHAADLAKGHPGAEFRDKRFQAATSSALLLHKDHPGRARLRRRPRYRWRRSWRRASTVEFVLAVAEIYPKV